MPERDSRVTGYKNKNLYYGEKNQLDSEMTVKTVNYDDLSTKFDKNNEKSNNQMLKPIKKENECYN